MYLSQYFNTNFSVAYSLKMNYQEYISGLRQLPNISQSTAFLLLLNPKEKAIPE